MDKELTIYGSDWCVHTQDTLQTLDDLGVKYQYVDVDQNPAAEQRIAGWNGGRAIRPTLDMNGDHYVNPNPAVLEDALRSHGYLT